MRGKMMNVLALLLISTSLATAGFFNRNPEKPNINEDVAVKEAVVVEFDKDDGNTKVSISPQDQDISQSGDHQKGYAANAKDKIDEETPHGHGFKARELVCDAYGKCKHKIASAMEKTVEKTKETMAETAHAAAAKVYEAEEGAKEAVDEAIGKVKDTVAHTTHKASDKAQEMKESAKDAAGEVSSKVKDKVVGKGGDVKEEAESKEGSFWCSGVCCSLTRLMRSVGGVMHLLGFAAAYGTGFWVTFASNYVLAGVLPRQQFAMVQSKMYPVYFRAMTFGIGLALLGHLSGLRRFEPLSMGMLQLFNLVAAKAMVLVNLMYFEPRATKVMLEKMKKEKEEGRAKEGEATVDQAAEVAGKAAQEKPEAEKFRVLRRLNSYSSLLNVATLMSLTWHLVHLGPHLHNVC